MGKYIQNIGLSILTLLLLFGIFEIGSRMSKRNFETSTINFLLQERTLFKSSYPSQYDETLGWIPKEFYTGKGRGNKQITIKENGIRSNGKDELSITQHSILAVGDSFTFGDEVSDNETWPAILERLTKKKVINGGVFGYGLDQTYLRAEQLIDIYHPDTLIVSFIHDDIERCQLSERSSVGKPYFDINQGELVLKNTPVPQPNYDKVGLLRRVAGHSYFLHRFMLSRFPGLWLEGIKWKQTTKVHSQGNIVSAMLLQKFSELAESNNIKVYILIQDTYVSSARSKNIVDSTLDYFTKIQTKPLNIIDLRSELDELRTNNNKEFKSLFFGKKHMTKAGNHFIAQKLKERLI